MQVLNPGRFQWLSSFYARRQYHLHIVGLLTNTHDHKQLGGAVLDFRPPTIRQMAFFVDNSVAPWVIHPNSLTATDTSFVGPGTTGIVNFSPNLIGYQNYAIVLNTTSSLWTASFYRNGTLEAGPTSYTSNPTINYVGFV